MPKLSERVGTFTDSVIRRMTRISDEYGAINLSQGFPDFDPPQEIMDALAEAAYKGPHQYSITFGAENFRRALKKVSAPFVPVLYKIVLEEKEIRAPKGASTRERLYFNDEIKNLLCRALDELVPYYRRRV